MNKPIAFKLLLYVINIILIFSLVVLIVSADNGEHIPENPGQWNNGGGGTPLAKFNLTITSDTKNPFRDDDVYLVVAFKNNYLSKKLIVDYINLELGQMYNTSTGEKKIRIPKFEIEKNETKIFRYCIHIPKNTRLNQTKLIPRDQLNHKDERIHIKNHRVDRKNINFWDNVSIQNNPPIIDSGIVILNSQKTLQLNDTNTLYIIRNTLEPIEARFQISAHDTEDGENLQFSSFILSNDSPENNNVPHLDSFKPIGDFAQIFNNIKPEYIYSVGIIVRDKDNITTTTNARIYYKGTYYNSFSIPGSSFYEKTVILLSILITIIIIFLLYLRLSSCSKPIFTANRAIIIIFALWALYIISITVGPQKMPGSEDYIFFNTLPFFELIVYLNIFIIINYFIELSFSLDDDKGLIGDALWLNYFSTLIILLIFIFLFPRIDKISEVLSTYYITIAGIIGTIFALIVTLSGQFPKNIFTPTIVCSDQNQCAIRTGELFSYPKKLRYFVILYGAMLSISILGVTIGSHIQFNTLITEPMNGDLLNLISLAIFEITFLLMPPTIISLYYLMHVVTFRGKITIKSRPCGAEIYLSRRFEEEASIPKNPLKAAIHWLYKELIKLRPKSEVNRISQESRTEEETDLYPLKLLTPSTLMLMDGQYRLKLRYNDCEISETIEVRNGEENNYLFELLSLEDEYYGK